MNSTELYVKATEAAQIALATGATLPSGIVELGRDSFAVFSNVIDNEWSKVRRSRSKNAEGRGLALRNLRLAVIEWQTVAKSEAK